MLSIDYTVEGGWEKPQIIPYGPMKLATTAMCLHYGMSAYEGALIVKNNETRTPQAFRLDETL
jgi:branched-chain amino acid aminotransferase